MTSVRESASVSQTVRGLQIITAAMIMAALIFLAVVLVVELDASELGDGDRQVREILTYVAAGFAVVVLTGLAIAAPRIDPLIRRTLTNVVADTLDRRLAQSLLTRNIIILAMLESAGLFNLVIYMLERGALSLAVTGLVVLIMAAQFPTADRASQWIERQKRLLESS